MQQQNWHSWSFPTRAIKERLTPYDERHFIVKVARGEGADSAGVFPLVRDIGVHDDQRRVHSGFAGFKAHTLSPHPKRCRHRDKQIERDRE